MGKSILEKRWVTEMTNMMAMQYPDKPYSEVEEAVKHLYKKRMKDTTVSIFNSYENTIAETTLSGVIDWADKTEPLMAESGVFFYPKDKKRNVNTEIIKEAMLDPRKVHKKEMFKALDAGDEFLAAVKDIQQKGDKRAANSGYGAEGQSSSFLYNLHSAMSVTASGRGQLSTACMCFENLLADNVKFYNINEFATWVNNILEESKDWKIETRSVIKKCPTEEMFVDRYMRKFGETHGGEEKFIRNVYNALNKEMRIRVYYKANLVEFLSNYEPCSLFSDIACTSVEFIDPNEPPNALKKDLSKLVSWVTEFVNYKHGIHRYEDKTRYLPRAATIIMDTDSTFLYYGGLLRTLVHEILPEVLVRDGDDTSGYNMRILNTLSAMSSAAIDETLDKYLGNVHVAQDDKKFIVMKNEFYYTRVIVTYAKKSYIGLVSRQESTVFKTPKIDVKGVNFFKTTSTEATSSFIYNKLLSEQLLNPKGETPSLKDSYEVITEYQRSLVDNISDGDLRFFNRGTRVKTPDAYANPMRISQYRAVHMWNAIVDDADRINLPASVTIVKVKLATRTDARKLGPWPEIYAKVIDMFDNDPDVGGEYEPGGIFRKGGKGIKAIAVPDTMDDMPEWIIPIIDVDRVVSANMALFTQLYRPMGMTKATPKNGPEAKYYQNIVRI